jgi:glycosyltransferase involved in cell wall biosynthesis
MKSCFFLFSHPAPYKVNLFNGLAKHLHLTVFFERELSGYAKEQYLAKENWKFNYRMLKGIPIGKENHVSFEVKKHLSETTYDYIVINGYSSWTEIDTILYLQRNKIPYYLYVNGGVIRKDIPWKFALKKKLISGAKGYFSPTPIVDDYLVHYGAKRETIMHYPYSTIFQEEVLNIPLSIEEKKVLRKTVGLPKDGHIFISVGQFIPRKNFSELIRLWKHMPKDDQLIIVGNGPLKKKYQTLIRKFKLSNIILKPFQPKNLLLSMLRASDGFILLSKEDIYGHVINEALSQGIPVLSTDQVISSKVLIKQGVNGYRISFHSMSTFPKKVHQLRLLQNPEASLMVAKENTIEQMVKSHLVHFGIKS